MTKVLIFGTFSLFTKAHLAMGLKAKEAFPDASITYVPAAKHYIEGYNKDIIDIDDKTRIDLLEKAVKPYGFKVSRVEIDGETDGTTYATANYFKGHGIDVIVSIGMDNVENIIEWTNGVELAKNNEFLVFTRGKSFNSDAFKFLKKATVVPFEEYEQYSSTAAKLAYYNKDYLKLMDIVVPEVYVYLMEEYNNG